jgi:predicted secreted protein
MNVASGIVVYVLLWWWIFFMALPFGARAPEQPEVGHATSAPARPHLWKKALAATVISAVLWLVVWWAVNAELFSFRDWARTM